MLTLKNLRRQALVLAIAGAVGIAGSAQAALPASNVAAHAVRLSRGDVVSGPLAISRPIHVVVELNLRNESQLQSFLATAAKPSTPMAQRTMSRAQFNTQHAPTMAQAQQVAAFLTRTGFHNVKIAPNRLLVTADGSAAAAQAAFKTSFVSVRTHDGRQAFGNTSDVQIPAALQSIVHAVMGLQNVHIAHILSQRAPGGALQPMTTSGTTATYHFPKDFPAIYDATSLPTAAGVNVGIISVGDMAPALTDFSTFLSANPQADQTIVPGVVCVDTTVDGSVDPTCGSTNSAATTADLTGEWDLDSQDIVGIGGGYVGKMTFYSATDFSFAGLVDAFNVAANDPDTTRQAKIINVSIGGCETGVNGAGDSVFQAAAAAGITFSISTGDSGADECGDGGTTPSWPASNNNVIAVGGTTLYTNGGYYANESVWSGAGGSASTVYSQPAWQNGVVPGTMRGLPDVAFDADPNTGAVVVISNNYYKIGGTSLASPLFVGSWARLLAANPGLGFAGPYLYNVGGTGVPTSAYHDVTSGNNGGEFAKTGWDYASGFGSFDLARVNAAIGSGPGSNVLQNGAAVSGLSGSRGGTVSYTANIPAGASNLVISISGGVGDADLYVKFGSEPTARSFDCRPLKSGNNETCSFAAPRTGTYYIDIKGATNYGGVTLEASWQNAPV